MTLLDRIRNWRLKRKIPENQKGSRRWRYKGNGIDIEYLNDNQEVKMYNYARAKLKEKEELEL